MGGRPSLLSDRQGNQRRSCGPRCACDAGNLKVISGLDRESRFCTLFAYTEKEIFSGTYFQIGERIHYEKAQ